MVLIFGGCALVVVGFLGIVFAGPIALVIILVFAMIFAHQAAILMIATFLIPAELVIMLFRGSTLLWTIDGAYSAAYDSVLAWPGSLLAWLALFIGGYGVVSEWGNRGALWDDFKQGMAGFSATPAAAALPAPVKAFSLNPEVNAAIAAVMSGPTYKTAAVALDGRTERQRQRDQDTADSTKDDADFKQLIEEMQRQVNDPNSATNAGFRRANAEIQAAIERGDVVYHPVRQESPELIYAHIPGLIGGLFGGIKSVVKGVGMATVATGSGIATVGIIRKFWKR